MAFRQRSALHTYESHFGPNMTPMVDVVMVILIFFMASTSFVGAEWFLRAAIPRHAPEIAESQLQEGDAFKLPPARFEIALSRNENGATIVSSRGMGVVTLAELPGMLRELVGADLGADPEVILLVRAEPDVPYADVIRAHEAAAAAGIRKVGMQ